jgi:polysaccharide pyruvyl transferase WcaK-like protein
MTPRRAPGARGTIFLDHSGHALTNLGDVAMLQAAATRLSARFPGWRLRIPTSAPERLGRFCPATESLPADGLRELAGQGYLPLRHRLPRRMAAGAARLEARLRGRHPEWLDSLALRRARPGSPGGRAAAEILSALGGSDLFVAAGGGYLTDAFPDKAWSALTLLRRAQRRGIPTALVSQGIGPLEEPALRALAARVLVRADLIALREGRSGPSLLASVGVDGGRFVVTGDDAVAAAYAARREGDGDRSPAALGINLRSASYAGLDGEAMAAVGAAVRRIAAELRAPIAPLPIALDEAGSDSAAIRDALGETGSAEPEPSDPAGAIARTSRCRVVVTASYHAAVFALAPGIPSVGISRTRYYAGKLGGLEDLFGPGARVVSLDEPAWKDRLASDVRDLWAGARERRAALLGAAGDQVRRQEDAYDRIAALAGGSVAAARTGRAVEASA